jgi:ABC-type microcin C transport system duplicated ATPase subunit YejF
VFDAFPQLILNARVVRMPRPMCALSGYVIVMKDPDIAEEGAASDFFEAPTTDSKKA